MMKKGFTLIELLVVIAMLIILMGAVTTSVAQARKRAKITKATTDCQEITNAILAYEKYLKPGSTMKEMTDAPATKSALGFILGTDGETDLDDKVPILYNAAIKGENILDPWGSAYRVTIKVADVKVDDKILGNSLSTAVQFPNYFRRTSGVK